MKVYFREISPFILFATVNSKCFTFYLIRKSSGARDINEHGTNLEDCYFCKHNCKMN